MIYGQKRDLLERLLEDCLVFEAEDKEAERQPDNPARETAEDRVSFALRLVKNMQDESRRPSADLTESLTAVSPGFCSTFISSPRPRRNLTRTATHSFSSCVPLSKTSWQFWPTAKTRPSPSSQGSPPSSCRFLSSPPTMA